MYLCISTYNCKRIFAALSFVVNCFKMCIFALARTTSFNSAKLCLCCELLQNVYLCISTYNDKRKTVNALDVVNCFKMCIFALARTTYQLIYNGKWGCELLQNVYLCISTYNCLIREDGVHSVVNCFKMCIFALARTTLPQEWTHPWRLWIASKCVSLH